MIRPEFREPWTNGAHAYFEADNFEAAKAGFKRKRKVVMFHMANSGEAGEQLCQYCQGKLNAPALAASREHGNNVRSESPASDKCDVWSTWHYFPLDKSVRGGLHYICSWSNLMGSILGAAH